MPRDTFPKISGRDSDGELYDSTHQENEFEVLPQGCDVAAFTES